MIEEYLATKSQDVAKKFRKNLQAGVNYLSGIGVSCGEIPSEEQYVQLKEYLHTLKIERGRYSGQFYENDYISDLMSLIRKFYEFEKGDITMPESTEMINTSENNEFEQPADLENSSENIAPLVDEEQISELVELEAKHGRRVKYDKPRKKFTVYLTQAMIEAVKDLARLDGVDTPAFTFGVFKQLIESRQEDIEYIRNRRYQVK